MAASNTGYVSRASEALGKLIRRKDTRQGSVLSPIQVALVLVVFTLALTAEVLILRANSSNSETASQAEQSSYIVTNLANIQRETLLLQAETHRLASDPGQDMSRLELRRALLSNQLRLSQRFQNPETAASVQKIQHTLNEYDNALASWLADDTGGLATEDTPIGDILVSLELQVKRLYDKEEQSFFSATSNALQAQHRAQILLLAVGGLLLFSGVVLGLWLHHSIRMVRTEIGQRRRAENALRETSEHLNTVITNSPVIMSALDHTGVFTLYEGKGLEALAQEPGELVGRSIFDVYADYPEVTDKVRGALAGEKVDFNLAIDRLVFDCRYEPLRDNDGRVTGVVGVAYDITALKQAERDLEQAKDEALQGSRAKSDFLASMSHEIRTPMNAIIGMTELLKETPITTEQDEYLRISNAAGESLLTLISDILDISKIEAGQIQLEQIDFDLGLLVAGATESLALAAHDKGLELNYRLRPGVPLALVGDTGRLTQIVTNLLTNAIKFTEHGSVALEIENDPEVDKPGALLIKVSDTGIGIPRDKLQVIFDSFTQVDASTTRQYGGTGLGLSITRQLINLMGGRIWAESEIGRGSTFFFTVQLEVQARSGSKRALPAANLRGLKILVVDDNADSRMILKELLSEWGATAAGVDTGYQALAEIGRAENEGEAYHLLLLDGHMRGMNGFTVVKYIQENHPNLAGGFIMMLNSDKRKEEVPRCMELGINNFLIKPVKHKELLGTIRQAVLELRQGPQGSVTIPIISDIEQLGEYRILMAEDSKDNRFLIEAYLKSSRYQLDVAENGEVAVAKFVSNDYDLVLMDMQMPVMDGYAATRAIRQWEQDHSVKPKPIVALTAHALADDMQKSLDAGCNTHLTKPIRKTKLIATLDEHIGGS